MVRTIPEKKKNLAFFKENWQGEHKKSNFPTEQ